MSSYNTGTIVAAQCVKMLDRQNAAEHESHDSWWSNIRDETVEFMKMQGCNVVLGYTECTAI